MSELKRDDLLHYPFCGTPADANEFPYPYHTSKGTPLFVMGCASPYCGAEFHKPSAKEAIDSWNRRTGNGVETND